MEEKDFAKAEKFFELYENLTDKQKIAVLWEFIRLLGIQSDKKQKNSAG